MANCLIALGSNLGDRADHLRRAFEALAGLPNTRLIARSGLHNSAPVGGPARQGDFLNATALISTSIRPAEMLVALQKMEAGAERTAGERWAARPLDLDLALYGDIHESTVQLTVPHPRMVYRPFVLRPALEIAPWMLHAESGWTVQRLLAHLVHGENAIAIASDSPVETDRLIERLERHVLPHVESSPQVPGIRRWSSRETQCSLLPKLILARSSPTGVEPRQRRKMLRLPSTGPVAWIGDDPTLDPLDEAVAAVQAVWPQLFAGR